MSSSTRSGQRGAWAASVRHTRAYHHAWTLHYRTLSGRYLSSIGVHTVLIILTAFILSFLVILHNACMSKSKSSHGLSLPHVSFARRNARTAEFSRDEASSFFRLASAFPHRPVALHYATQSTSMTTVSDSNFQIPTSAVLHSICFLRHASRELPAGP